MQFLIEATIQSNQRDHDKILQERQKYLPTQQNLFQYNASKGTQRDSLILNWLKKLPNAKYLRANLIQFIIGIKELGWKSPYLNYILTINKANYEQVEEIIYQLFKNKKLTKDYYWLHDISILSENISDILYKIKLLTFVSIPENKQAFQNIKNFNIESLYDRAKNEFISRDKMKDIFDSWARENGEEVSSSNDKTVAYFNDEELNNNIYKHTKELNQLIDLRRLKGTDIIKAAMDVDTLTDDIFKEFLDKEFKDDYNKLRFSFKNDLDNRILKSSLDSAIAYLIDYILNPRRK